MSKTIKIPLSQEDLVDLMENKVFYWNFGGGDVELYNSDLRKFKVEIEMEDGKVEKLDLLQNEIEDLELEMNGMAETIYEFKTRKGKIITSDKIKNILTVE